MRAEDLEERLQNLIDGSISPQDLEALKAVLATDVSARMLYLDTVEIHGMLGQRNAGATGEVVPMDRVLARQKRRAFRLAGVATAAAVAAALVVSVLVVLPDAPVARFDVSPKTEFTLTHAVRDGERAPEGRVVEVGSRLRVERGAVELSFASGVKGIVRGPADLTLRGEGLVDLASGIVWFEVPLRAVGFQVDTPDFLLTDLGTEFGVASRPGVMDEVHVFSGEVEVRHHRGLEEKVSVVAGQARAAGGDGGWEQVDYSPGLFVTELPGGDPAPPYLHWSFDSFEGEVVPVGGTHPAAAEIISTRGFPGEGPEVIEGPVGGALAFDATGDHIKTDWPGIGGSVARSVAFWVRLPSPGVPGQNSTLVTWGDPTLNSPNRGWAVHAVNMENTITEPLREKLRGRTLLQLWTGVTWITGVTDLADGEWHHVAICYGGNTGAGGRPQVTAYVDGRYEPTYHHSPRTGGTYPPTPPIDTDISSSSSNPLLIGRSKTRPRASCNAAIDELYIFEGSLGHDLVYSLAHPTPGWRP